MTTVKATSNLAEPLAIPFLGTPKLQFICSPSSKSVVLNPKPTNPKILKPKTLNSSTVNILDYTHQKTPILIVEVANLEGLIGIIASPKT